MAHVILTVEAAVFHPFGKRVVLELILANLEPREELLILKAFQRLRRCVLGDGPFKAERHSDAQ